MVRGQVLIPTADITPKLCYSSARGVAWWANGAAAPGGKTGVAVHIVMKKNNFWLAANFKL